MKVEHEIRLDWSEMSMIIRMCWFTLKGRETRVMGLPSSDGRMILAGVIGMIPACDKQMVRQNLS